jgi:hypothetical protein
MADADSWLVREAQVRAKINAALTQSPATRFTVKALAGVAGCTTIMAKRVLRGMEKNGDAQRIGRVWVKAQPNGVPGPIGLDMNSSGFQLTCTAQVILYNEALLLYAQNAAPADIWHYLLCAVAYHDGIFPTFWNPEEDV